MLYFVFNTLPKVSFTTVVTAIRMWGYASPDWSTCLFYYYAKCSTINTIHETKNTKTHD